MKTINELWAYYNSDLLPDLQVMEVQRKEVAKKVRNLNIWCGIGVGLSVLFIWLIFPILTLLALIFVWIYFYKQYTKAYHTDFKSKVIYRVIKFIDESLEYSPTNCIPTTTYYASKLFPKSCDRYKGDDYVYGNVGKTKLRFSELHTEYKTETRDAKGNRQTKWHTIFRGIFFIADFNKHFNGETMVLPDTAQKLFGNWLGNLFQSWNFTRDDLIKLEDPEFERLFVVYGTDQIEARYILSTSLMKRIVDFKKKTGKTIYLSFINNEIYVAVSYNKNLFEPKIFKTLLDFNVIREYYSDLQLALGIIEELNLNTRIWSKQ
ncbi:DUF3137 domain-containing protein [Candidatus Dependentiae bacterium]|nr:DUF3137 domain-containing protein [Candidatus Dependentiae bacterium]